MHMEHRDFPTITFCFPKDAHDNVDIFLDALLDGIENEDCVGIAGYPTEAALREDIAWRFEESELQQYQPLDDAEEDTIRESITSTVLSCNEKLSLPDRHLRVYVFPWLPPFDEDDRTMGYVSGFMPHPHVLHIFLSPKNFSYERLVQTVAHEFNHAVFFQYHPLLNPHVADTTQVMGDVIAWEGLAENFVEEVTRGHSFFVSQAGEEEMKDAVERVRPVMTRVLTEGDDIYESVFFGSTEYKRWTGYIAGYAIIRSYRQMYPRVTWTDLMQMDPAELIKGAMKT